MQNNSYENLGKLMVWNMIDKGDGQYANGGGTLAVIMMMDPKKFITLK